uniref:Uncharacterized protein n=1 Tax=Siphoviridae sp. ctkfT29 TaxID=2827278 RepID=A0A8S5RAA7_9CAUD|nr:MAG TPA: hypothetical protein [Siphoviridae sp. ctkfT29]
MENRPKCTPPGTTNQFLHSRINSSSIYAALLLSALGVHGGLSCSRIDSDDRNAVQILGPQRHAHNRKALTHSSAIVALSVEADQGSFTAHGVSQAQAGELARGVNIVQVNVLNGGCNDLVAGNLSCGQQEQGGVAHKVLDVGQAESVLHGHLSAAQIVVSIQDVRKADNFGYILLDGGKLVQHLALSLRQSGLPGGSLAGQAAGVQEGVELGHHLVLQLCQESVIGLLYGDCRAVLVHVLDGHGFCVLLQGDIFFRGLGDSGLAIGDYSTGGHSAALQRNASGVRHQSGARLLADGPHDAVDFAQCVPVVGKAGYKVQFPRSHAGVDIGQTVAGGGQGFNFSCCHLRLLSCVLVVQVFLNGLQTRLIIHDIAPLFVLFVDVGHCELCAAAVGRRGGCVSSLCTGGGDVLAVTVLQALFQLVGIFYSSVLIQLQRIKQAVSLCQLRHALQALFGYADFFQHGFHCLFFGGGCLFSVNGLLVSLKGFMFGLVLLFVTVVALALDLVQFLLDGRQLLRVGFIAFNVRFQAVHGIGVGFNDSVLLLVGQPHTFKQFTSNCHFLLLFFGASSSAFAIYKKRQFFAVFAKSL